MNRDELVDYCLAKPGAEETYPWGEDELVAKVTPPREEETEHPARGPAWTVSIPSWRDDLDRPIDLVEEVLRLHGTDKIPAAVVQSPGLLADDDLHW